MNQGYSMYEQIAINTSNPLKIVLMMYDGAINFLNKSIEYAENGDTKNKNIYANMARDIIVEFNNSLNMESVPGSFFSKSSICFMVFILMLLIRKLSAISVQLSAKKAYSPEVLRMLNADCL